MAKTASALFAGAALGGREINIKVREPSAEICPPLGAPIAQGGRSGQGDSGARAPLRRPLSRFRAARADGLIGRRKRPSGRRGDWCVKLAARETVGKCSGASGDARAATQMSATGGRARQMELVAPESLEWAAGRPAAEGL